jgi:hypothetical protein
MGVKFSIPFRNEDGRQYYIHKNWTHQHVYQMGGYLELYLVAAADHLLHSKSESKESMLTCLAILGDTSLKTSGGGVNDQNSTVSLGGTGDHVLDEVTVSRGINDRTVVLGGLKLP